MGLFTNSYAWAITVSVLMSSMALGMLLYFFLVPWTFIHVFMLAMSLTLVIAVSFNTYEIYAYQRDKEAQRNAIKKVAPSQCPDYWTSEWDSCKQTYKCNPYFETNNAAYPTVLMNGADAPGGLDLKQYAAKGDIAICNENKERTFPWVPVLNACAAVDRTI
jgi:hypothetical protein